MLIAFAVIAILALAALLYGIYCTKNLKPTKIDLHFKNLPESFEGFRIAHISDLHNDTLGKDNAKVLSILKSAKPDMIAITGDMIDSRHTDIKVATALARKMVKIAPCYYVCGNHEARMPDNYEVLMKKLTSIGVTAMKNEKVALARNNNKITIIGAEDPYVIRKDTREENADIMDNALTKLHVNSDSFTLLLSHKPELLSTYAKHNIDLALTGHAHGGQIRLPFVGGLFAPNQGFLPKLCSGIHKEENTTMVISRGVGNSQFPIRFLNPPEIPIITLHK